VLLLRQGPFASLCNVRVPRAICAGFLLSSLCKNRLRLFSVIPAKAGIPLSLAPSASQRSAKRALSMRDSGFRRNDEEGTLEWRMGLYSLGARGVFAQTVSQEWRSVPCVRTLDASPSNTRMLDSRLRGNGGNFVHGASFLATNGASFLPFDCVTACGRRTAALNSGGQIIFH